MKKWISRHNALAAVSTVTAAAMLTACGGAASSSAASSAASEADSAASSSEASSAAESWGDVKLTMWGAEEDQTMLREMADAFIAENADKGNVTIEIGVQSESSAKDTVLADPEAAADVFAFADDQLNELVAAGALQEILLNPEDVKSRNLAGSVEAATMNDKLYAYPMTADNGYFLYYDKSVLSEDDVKSMDALLAKADASGKKFMMSLNDAWYIYSFYAGAGLKATLADDGINTVCNWNEAPGADVTQAILDMSAQSAFKSGADADIVSGIKDGSCCAAISGTWNAKTAQDTWGDNYAATKLPTYTLNGEQVQMASFSGFKLIGVNPHSSNVGAAMLLADYVTNEENETLRFQQRAQGPSNTNALAAASSPALTAVVAQSEYANLQRVGGNYWASAETLGQICVNGNPDVKDPQTLIEDAVAGITAPVTQ